MLIRRFVAVLLATSTLHAADLITLSPSNYTACVPGGKEADAIIGDYVLRNDRIVAAVADPRLLMGRSASRWAIHNVAGALIDLTRRDQSNDLLTAFYPALPRFKPDAPNYAHEFVDESLAHLKPGREPVSAPRVTLVLPAYELESGKSVEDLEALPLHLRALPRPRVEVRYILEDGWDYIRVETEYHNPTDHPVDITPFMSLRVDDARESSATLDNRLFLVLDPWWKAFYGVATPDHAIQSGAAKPPRYLLGDLIDGQTTFSLPAGGRKTLVRAVIPGESAQAVHATAAALLGAPPPPVTAAEETPPATGFADVAAADEAGNPLPARILYHGREGTPDPFFFPASGGTRVRNAVHTPTGRSLDPLPPGRYDVTVSCGPEFNAFTSTITIATAKTNVIQAVLTRAYSTPGWISADLHNHSTRSGASEIFYVYPYSKDPTADGDSTASPEGRVLSLLASGLEFAVATEHNVSSTYAPILAALDLQARLATCPGIGLTAGRRHTVTHQNVFPAPFTPGRQDGGVPQRPEHVGQLEWMLKWTNSAEKLVQIVQPRDSPLQPAVGMDVVDVIDLEPLVEGKPLAGHDNRILDWVAKLNAGYRLPAVVNSGTFDNYTRAGAVRNYIRVPDDQPATLDPLDVVRAVKRGHVILTTGPFLEVALEAEGASAAAAPGDSVSIKGTKARLFIRVKTARTAPVDRVQVLVNGKPDPALEFSRARHPDLFKEGALAFDHAVDLAVPADAHLIVVASGSGPDLLVPSASPRPDRVQVAVSNPIWIDAGADGYRPRSPLNDTVMTTLDFITAPLAREGETQPGRVRLELSNTGDELAVGVARLEAVPPTAATIPGPVEQPYRIPPGGQAFLDWPIFLNDALIATGFPLRSTYNNAGTFGLRVPRGQAGASHRAAQTFMCLDYPFPSLPPVASPEPLADLLKSERPYPVLDRDRKPLAECRWGVSGSNLAFHAVVHDPAPERRPLQWEGSCIELFGSMPGRSSQYKPAGGYFPIRQVYLLPQAGDAPAAGFKRENDQIVPAPEMVVQSAPLKDGYEVRALIPLALLGADADRIARSVFFAGTYTPVYLLGQDPSAGRILLEARVTAPRPSPQPPRRGTIFGSPAPHADHNAFGRMRLTGPVQVELKIEEPLSLGKGAGPARVRVNLQNQGTRPATDTLVILAEPADAVRESFSRPFLLDPGASTSLVFTLSLNGNPHLPWVDLVVPRSANGSIAGTPSPRLPVIERPLGVIPNPGRLDRVPQALEGEPEMTVAFDGKTAARFRAALAAGALALHATVLDDPGQPQDPAWKGSCVEVFAAGSDTNAIGHVFLTPGSGAGPAAALIPEGGATATAPGVQVQSARTDGGYTLTALIPLGLLNLSPDPDRLKLEFQLSRPDAGGKMSYGAVFGSTRAYMTPLSYGAFKASR